MGQNPSPLAVYHYSVGAPEPRTIIRERYRLDALIGEGGMASVWRAWDLTLQRPVAVKLLFARDARDEEVLVGRFLREARIAASVQHRNVIHIVDFGTTLDNQPFMVMELLEGETLATRLRRERPLPVPDVVQIGSLTLRGLSAVHAAGIIHRDLKPDNVYLKLEGNAIYPKILDFGISRSIEPASGARSALTTRDGVIVGTPEYMSPEQARGVKAIDYRTDLYSMGVVLYESLTGRLPYTSENVGDLIIKIVTGNAPKVHELMRHVPEPISRVVERAMARNAGDRYADATAMQEALLEAATRTLGAPSPQALSDLPPQGTAVPWHMRSTRPPPAHLARSTPLLPGTRLAPPQPALSAAGAPAATKPGWRDARQRAIAQAQRLASRVRASCQPWAAPLTAAGLILVLGALSLWLAPNDERASASAALPQAPKPVAQQPGNPPAPAPTAATPEPAKPKPAKPKPAKPEPAKPEPAKLEPTSVRVQLHGVPENARIALDGAPAQGPQLQLPRSSQSHRIVVTAPGKRAFRTRFVADADHSIDVQLEPKARPPKKRRKRVRRRHRARHPHALRVPDF